MKVILLITFILVLLIAGGMVIGSRRWKSTTDEMHADLEAARLPYEVKRFRTGELIELPLPVQRYFRAALRDAQPIILAMNVEHVGTFNMSENGEQWKPFTSTQRVITQRPGFDWEARISMFPGLTVRVHDAYIAGEGILHASLFGLVTLVNQRGRPELAEGELMRFLAEAAWYPTALLPGQGVRWEAVDDASARAVLTDGNTTVNLLFRFNDDNLIESVYSDARSRTIDNTSILTPWEGRWSRYELRDGIRVPMEGEVSWVLPEGPVPYWRGSITNLTYEFAK